MIFFKYWALYVGRISYRVAINKSEQILTSVFHLPLKMSLNSHEYQMNLTTRLLYTTDIYKYNCLLYFFIILNRLTNASVQK